MKINQDTMRWMITVSLMAVIVSAAKTDINAESVASDDTAFKIEMMDPAEHDCRFIDPNAIEPKPQENKRKIGHQSSKGGLFSCLFRKTRVEYVLVGYHGTCWDRVLNLHLGWKTSWAVSPKYPLLGRDRFYTTSDSGAATKIAAERARGSGNDAHYVCYILMDSSVLRNQQKVYIPETFYYNQWGIRKTLHGVEFDIREYETRLFQASDLDFQNSKIPKSTKIVRFGETAHKLDDISFTTVQAAWPKHLLKHMKFSCYLPHRFEPSSDTVNFRTLLTQSADPNAKVDPLWGRILGAEEYIGPKLK